MASFSSIDAVSFSIVGNRDIDDLSQVNVVSEELFLGNKPVDAGLYTTELGAEVGYPCKTCGKRSGKDHCLGHFGELQLRYPLLNPLFMKDIAKWLKVGCIKCGTPLLDPMEFQSIPASTRLSKYVLAAQPSSGKTITCRNPKCKTVQPKIEKNNDDYISFSVIESDGGVR